MVMVSLLDGRHYQQVLNAEQPDFVVPAESSAGDVMGDYSLLGIEHIWGGIDHLMFVFGLLLLVGGGSAPAVDHYRVYRRATASRCRWSPWATLITRWRWWSLPSPSVFSCWRSS